MKQLYSNMQAVKFALCQRFHTTLLNHFIGFYSSIQGQFWSLCACTQIGHVSALTCYLREFHFFQADSDTSPLCYASGSYIN